MHVHTWHSVIQGGQIEMWSDLVLEASGKEGSCFTKECRV